MGDQPRAGVTVRVRTLDTQDVRATGVTDAEGVCAFPATDLREVDVDAWGEGLCPETSSPSELEWDTNVVRFELRPGREVVGRVIDAATGGPVSGARIWVSGCVGATDVHGRFRISGVAPGEMTVILADALTYTGRAVCLRAAPPDATEPPLEIALSRAPQFVGIVRDPEGWPVPFAEVHLRSEPRLPFRLPDDATPLTPAAETALARDLVAAWEGMRADVVRRAREDGTFTHEPKGAIEAGATVRLRAAMDGFGRSRWVSREVGAAGAPIELRLRRPARVEVEVVGPDGPCPRATIYWMQGDDCGRQRGATTAFDNLSDEPVWIVATNFQLQPAVRRVVPTADTTTRVSIALEEGGVIEGVVVDESGAPLEMAGVFAGDATRDADLLRSGAWIRSPRSPVGDRDRTNADGRFRLPGLDARECYVVATAREGTLWSRAPVRVVPGGPPVRITVYRRATVTGRFVTADGVPARNPPACEVAVGTRRMDAKRADAAGVVVFPAIDDGDATLVAFAEGFAWMHRTFVVRGTDPVDLGTIVLRPGARFAGTVVDRRGVPVANAIVGSPLCGTAEDQADVHGRFLLEDFPPPPFELELDGDDVLTTRIRVTEVLPTGLRLVVTRRGRARGLVLDADGTPAAERLFYLRRVGADAAAEEKADPDVDHDDPWQSVVSGPDGRFEHPVEPGTWAVRTDDDEAETSPALQTFTITDGEIRDVKIVWPADAPK